MQVVFLKESIKNKKINFLFNRIEEETINNKKNNKNIKLLLLPIDINGKTKTSKTKISKRKIEKIIKHLKKNKIRKVVLSISLSRMDLLKQALTNNNITIIKGIIINNVLLENILSHICKASNTLLSKSRISFLCNNVEDIIKQIIIILATKVKSVNIVTNNKVDFINLENYLYNELGIITKLSHNIDKTSNIIINFDFEQEEINKQKIPNHCIIISVNQNITINSKSFQGIIIKDFNIVIPSKLKINGFDDKNIYESIIINKNNKVYKNYNYNEIRKMIKTDRIRIENLLGEKGIINDKEFYNFFLTKS